MELVDRGGQQRLLTPRRPVHRVQRHAAEDPRGVVAHELRVGQRPEHEPRGVRARGTPTGSCRPPRRARPGRRRRRSGTPPTDPRAARSARPGSRGAGPRPTRSSVTLRSSTQSRASGIGHHVGEQVLQLEDLDAAVDHLGDEVEVVAAGLLQPDDVVEQQLVAVLRGEPLVGEPRRADQDSAQLAGLRPHAQPGFGRAHRTARLSGGHQRDRDDRRQPPRPPTTASSALVNTGSRLSLRAHT